MTKKSNIKKIDKGFAFIGREIHLSNKNINLNRKIKVIRVLEKECNGIKFKKEEELVKGFHYDIDADDAKEGKIRILSSYSGLNGAELFIHYYNNSFIAKEKKKLAIKMISESTKKQINFLIDSLSFNNPICPFCKKKLKPTKFYGSYYDSFGWSCECSKDYDEEDGIQNLPCFSNTYL